MDIDVGCPPDGGCLRQPREQQLGDQRRRERRPAGRCSPTIRICRSRCLGLVGSARLELPGRLNVAGVTIPGIPFVIIGHNERIGWGLTNVGADVQDFFVEQLDPPGSDIACG